jgi:hypothetical protein
MISSARSLQKLSVFLFMKKNVDRNFQEDQDNQDQRRQMEGRGYPGTEYDGQVHDNHAFVWLEKEVVEGNPFIFFVFDEVNEHRDAVAQKQRDEGGKKTKE